MRLLLVEDDPHIRRFVRAALEGEGCRVAECDTLRQGLIDAGTRKPDLVILDLGLPDGDGRQFVTDLRSWSAMPVLVLSALKALYWYHLAPGYLVLSSATSAASFGRCLVSDCLSPSIEAGMEAM